MNTNEKTVLIVDDDPRILKAISLRLKAAGYQVLAACNGVEALTLAQARKPDLIITDIWMPVGVGFSLAHRLRDATPAIPIIFLTASKQANLKSMSKEVGAAGFLEKPYSPEVLLKTVHDALAMADPALKQDAA